MQTLRWRSIVLVAAVVAACAALAIWGPVWAHARQVREREREENLAAARAQDASKLAPCDAYQLAWAKEAFPESEDEDADFSMLVMPAFHDAWRVSVTGTQVVVVEHWHARTRSAHPAPIGEGERLEGRAELSKAHAKALTALMRERIANAGDERQVGADGAFYVFHAGNACASTWSPDLASGAGRLTRIGEILGFLASRVDPVQQAQAEQALVPLLRSFEHRLGDAPIPERDAEVSLYLGPVWNEAARKRSQSYAH